MGRRSGTDRAWVGRRQSELARGTGAERNAATTIAASRRAVKGSVGVPQGRATTVVRYGRRPPTALTSSSRAPDHRRRATRAPDGPPRPGPGAPRRHDRGRDARRRGAPRDRPLDDRALSVGTHRGLPRGRPAPGALRRPQPRQAPGDAPHALRVPPRPHGCRAGRCRRSRRRAGARATDQADRPGRPPRRRRRLARPGRAGGAGRARWRPARHIDGAARRAAEPRRRDHRQPGEELGWRDPDRPARAHDPLRRRPARARRQRGRLARLPSALGPHGRVARRAAPAPDRRRRHGPPRRRVAARLWAGDDGRPQVVARIDRHGGQGRPRGAAGRSGRARRRGAGWVLPGDETRARRPNRLRAAPALDPTIMGWFERDCTSGHTAPSCSTATATPDQPPGGTAASSGDGARTRTDASGSSSSRIPAASPATRSRPRPIA